MPPIAVRHAPPLPPQQPHSHARTHASPTRPSMQDDTSVTPRTAAKQATLKQPPQPVVAPTTTAQVKVSSINVADERFHLSMLTLLGCILTQLVAFEEMQHPQGRGPISMFHTAYVPSISIASYLKRIALYSKISTEVVIQAVLHVHQLMQRPHAPLIVNKLNIHRLLLTSIMTTAKFYDDAHYNNAYYSFVGGVPLRELNALEVEFLSLLNFDFYTSGATYQYFYGMLTERNIHQNGCACQPLLEGLPAKLAISEYTQASAEFDPVLLVSEESDEEDLTMDEQCGTPRASSECSASASSTHLPRPSPASSIAHSESQPSVTPVAMSHQRVAYMPSSQSMDDGLHHELGSIRIEDERHQLTPRLHSQTPPAHVHRTMQRSASPVSFLSAIHGVGHPHDSPSRCSSVGSSTSCGSGATRGRHHVEPSMTFSHSAGLSSLHHSASSPSISHLSSSRVDSYIAMHGHVVEEEPLDDERDHTDEYDDLHSR